MADSKKYNGGTWQHSLRKLTTSTDTITTLPADIYANDTTATVGLQGNMVQSGTPTPTTPIQPQETGDRTGNLFNIDAKSTSSGYINNTFLKSDNSTNGSSYWAVSEYIKIDNYDNIYLLRINTTSSSAAVCFYDSAKTFISGTPYNGTTRQSISIPNNAVYYRLSYSKTNSNLMVNVGTSEMPYEPYGYKIPISSASTTTPVYLGEVESTRKIVKLVLDGNTSINDYAGGASTVGFVTQGEGILGNRILGKCTHFQTQSTGVGSTIDGVTFGINNSVIYFTFSAASVATYNLSDVASIKQYLADQYSAGTPVTVWYVLATPTTGIVNEPLRKIGNYADSVSGITIPTITGADGFDVLTTLKPSKVELTYTGWHDATVKEWDGSDWQ